MGDEPGGVNLALADEFKGLGTVTAVNAANKKTPTAMAQDLRETRLFDQAEIAKFTK